MLTNYQEPKIKIQNHFSSFDNLQEMEANEQRYPKPEIYEFKGLPEPEMGDETRRIAQKQNKRLQLIEEIEDEMKFQSLSPLN